jgi:tetratricopeptide (TPR) repeat protein
VPASAKSESLTRILLLLVPATAWAAFPFFSDFSTPKLIVAGLLGAPLLWQLRRVSLPQPAGWIPVAFLVASLPAFWRGPDGDLARQALVLEVLALATWWGAAQSRRELVQRLPGWLLAAGLGVLCFRILEWLWPGGPFTIGALAGSSTLGNPDLTAEFLAIALPLAVWRLWQPGSGGRVAAVALGAGTILVLATHSSITALGIASVGLLSLGITTLRRWPRMRLALLVVALLIGSLALFTVRERPALQGRLFLYKTASTVVSGAPLMGQGEGGFGRAYMDAQGQALQNERHQRSYWTNARHAHNVLLHLWSERGALPLSLLMLFFGLGLWRSREGAEWQLALLLGAAVSFMGSVSWAHVPFRLLASLLLGMGWSVSHGPVRWPRLSLTLPASLAALVVLLPLWHAAGDLAFGKGELETAHRLVPDNSRIQFALGQQRLAEGNEEGARSLLVASLPGHPNLGTLLTLGNLETRARNYVDAEQWYRQVLAWKPDFAAAYANLAWLYHRWGRESLADRHLTRALSLRPSDPAILKISRQIFTERRTEE